MALPLGLDSSDSSLIAGCAWLSLLSWVDILDFIAISFCPGLADSDLTEVPSSWYGTRIGSLGLLVLLDLATGGSDEVHTASSPITSV